MLDGLRQWWAARQRRGLGGLGALGNDEEWEPPEGCPDWIDMCWEWTGPIIRRWDGVTLRGRMEVDPMDTPERVYDQLWESWDSELAPAQADYIGRHRGGASGSMTPEDFDEMSWDYKPCDPSHFACMPPEVMEEWRDHVYDWPGRRRLTGETEWRWPGEHAFQQWGTGAWERDAD